MNPISFFAHSQSTANVRPFQERSDEMRSKPLLACNGIPMYHISVNDVDADYEKSPVRRLHKWGSYYHPDMLSGMCSVGADCKIYVDSSDEKYYYLHIYSRLDEYIFEDPSFVGSAVAWTPRVKGDSIVRAGFRMFYAAARVIDRLRDNQEFEESDYGHEWWDSHYWACGYRPLAVFASIRETRYEDEVMYEKIVQSSPDWMKPMLEKTRISV
ncbi:MAG: hypothetical protein LW630_09395 [Saprospiraceae bacterium]|jgi:hypothetical protein|nr:hypothetical protein [Saprospiraceae bacterium]